MRAVQGSKSGFSEAVSQQARENCKKKKEIDLSRHNARDRALQDAVSLGQAVLASSNTLQGMKNCHWQGMTHICPTLVAVASATDATPDAPLQLLAQDWQSRHQGVPELPQARRRTRPQPACFKEGTCMCRPHHKQHRELMKRCNKSIQDFLQNNAIADYLTEGQVVMAWVRTPKETEEGAPVAAPQVTWSSVPLHYKKPWRPTLLLLRLLNIDDETCSKQLLEETCEDQPFNFEILLEDKAGFSRVPCLRSWRQFILDIDLAFRWSLRFFRFVFKKIE